MRAHARLTARLQAAVFNDASGALKARQRKRSATRIKHAFLKVQENMFAGSCEQ